MYFFHEFLNSRTARTLGSDGDKKLRILSLPWKFLVGEVVAATKIASLKLAHPLKMVGFQSESPFSGVYFPERPGAKTQVAPENGWLEDHLPFGKAYFQGRFG